MRLNLVPAGYVRQYEVPVEPCFAAVECAKLASELELSKVAYHFNLKTYWLSSHAESLWRYPLGQSFGRA